MVSLSALAFLPFLLSDYVEQRRQLQQVKAELQRRTELYGERLERLARELVTLREFDQRIRIMANLQPTGEEMLAVGGTERDPLKGLKARLDEKVLDDLIRTAERQRQSFEELHAALRKIRRRLNCTPSIWPARGWVSSGYGYRRDPFTGLRQFHQGLDISNRIGTPIVAPADGVVARIWKDWRMGLTLKISHGYGITTLYGHLHKVLVKVGQRVKRGQKIALMGNSGRSTGPHLHYEVRLNGKAVNPRHYILN